MATTKPSQCGRGCGFFGTSQTKNLCSKCYNDFLREESDKILTPSTPSPSVSSDSATAAAAETGVGRRRCHVCKRKVGLLGFECRCSHVFCGSHRYAEGHSCPLDYKSAAKDALAKNNPLINSDKLYRI